MLLGLCRCSMSIAVNVTRRPAPEDQRWIGRPPPTSTWSRGGRSALTHRQAGAVVLRCAWDAVDRTDLTGSACTEFNDGPDGLAAGLPGPPAVHTPSNRVWTVPHGHPCATAGEATTSGPTAIAAAHPKSINPRVTNTINSQTNRPTKASLTPMGHGIPVRGGEAAARSSRGAPGARPVSDPRSLLA